MYPRPYPNLKQQRGLATVLIIVFVGLALTATSIGIMHSVRSTQQKQVAVHAVTHSQAGAWVAVEIFRRYLAGLNQTQLDALVLNQAISFQIPTASASSTSSSSGANNAPYINVMITNRAAPAGSSPTDAYKITTKISYHDTAAKSTSKIEAIYQFFPYLCANCQQISAVLDFYRDLNIGGGIEVRNQGGVNQGNFNVDGNINMNSVGISGVGKLQSTGNVTLGSSVPAQEVYANGTVTLSGAANVNKVSALTGIAMSGGTSANLLFSNGPVTLEGSVAVGNSTNYVTTKGTIAMFVGRHGQFTAGGNITIGGGTITQSSSNAMTSISGEPTVGTLRSVGNVTCTPVTWNTFTSLTTGGVTTGCIDNTKVVKNATVAPTSIATLLPFSMTKPVIDVWPLKVHANYIFEPVNGKMQVTVKNVNGITDGVYFLGSYYGQNRGAVDFLCTAVNTSGTCTAPATPNKTICQGASQYNGCISYNNTSNLDKWTLDSKNIAPGIMWFKGNLNIANGTYYNTFMASGNIETAGASRVYSSNYASYPITCSVNYPVNPSADFTGLYPRNLCDIPGTKMRTVAAGNPALIAGGYSPDAGGAYRGGDITLGASNEIFGSVIAGDYLLTGGTTIVHGYVTAVALTGAVSANALGGSTTIDLTNLPSTFSPNIMPNMSSVTSTNTDVAKVLWSRYL